MTLIEPPTDTNRTATFEPPSPGRWMLDTTHRGRRPTTRFMAAIVGDANGFAAFTKRFGLPLETMEFVSVNGYSYARPKAIGDNGKGGPPPPKPVLWLVSRLHPELRRRNRAASQAWAERRWRDDVDDWFDRGGRDAVVAANLAFQAFDVIAASDAELGAHLSQLADHLKRQFVLGFETHGGDIIPCGDYLAHCAAWGIPTVEATSLLAGASPPTVEARELLAPAAKAAQEARAAGHVIDSIDDVRVLSDAAAHSIDHWLEYHGWRLLNSDDVDCPTLHEQPDLQLRVVLSMDPDAEVGQPDPSPVRAQVPAGQRTLFDALLDEARYGLRLRDDNVGVRLNWPAGLARRAAQEAGRRLADREALTDPTHVMHCAPAELSALLTGATSPAADEISSRAAERAWQLSLDAPSYIGDEEPPPPVDVFPAPMARATRAVLAFIDAMQGTPDAPSETADGPTLHGQGVSGQPYEGRAVVIAGPEDDLGQIHDGDVLIAPFTSPSFNSLFPLLGAVAVEEGGPLSHTAIVSREFGIPAVVGVDELLASVSTGDRVEVDPTDGTVRVLTR